MQYHCYISIIYLQAITKILELYLQTDNFEI